MSRAMGLPPHASQSSGSGHGPFGEKAFKAALVVCCLVLVAGAVMAATGGSAVRGVGTALIVVCGVGLLTAGGGLLLERLTGRTPPPRPAVRASNGRGRH